MSQFAIEFVFLLLVPGQVVGLTLSSSVTNNQPSLSVSWMTVQHDLSLQYQVDYRVNGSTTWSTVSPNPTTISTTLEKLQSRTTYEVRVRAVSDVGKGAWSDTSSATTLNGNTILTILLIIYVFCWLLYRLLILGW